MTRHVTFEVSQGLRKKKLNDNRVPLLLLNRNIFHGKSNKTCFFFLNQKKQEANIIKVTGDYILSILLVSAIYK